MFSPKSVWKWYQSRPKWQRYALFVFFLIIIVLSVLCWPFRSSLGLVVGSKITPREPLVEALEDIYSKEMDRVEIKDEKIREEMKKEEKIREKLEEKQTKEKEKSDEVHKEIDSADSAGDVVAILNRRSRKRKTRRGKN